MEKKLSIEKSEGRINMKVLNDMYKYLNIQNTLNVYEEGTIIFTNYCKLTIIEKGNISVYFNQQSIFEKGIIFLKDEFKRNINIDELISMKIALSQYDDMFKDYDFSVDDIDFTKKGNNVIITNMRGRINEREETL